MKDQFPDRGRSSLSWHPHTKAFHSDELPRRNHQSLRQALSSHPKPLAPAQGIPSYPARVSNSTDCQPASAKDSRKSHTLPVDDNVSPGSLAFLELEQNSSSRRFALLPVCNPSVP